jgi:hypothetical protein
MGKARTEYSAKSVMVKSEVNCMSWRLTEINKKMEDMKTFFATQDLSIDKNNVRNVLGKFLELKAIMKNIDNNFHFLATIAANQYLKEKHGIEIDLEKGNKVDTPVPSRKIVKDFSKLLTLRRLDRAAIRTASLIGANNHPDNGKVGLPPRFINIGL